MKLIHLETVDSTNIYAKKLMEGAVAEHGLPMEGTASSKTDLQNLSDLNGTIVYADCQTAGHGRMGRFFYSPDKTGIYMSLIYAPAVPVENPALITASTAVAVCRVLDRNFGISTKIKWVNDIYLNSENCDSDTFAKADSKDDSKEDSKKVVNTGLKAGFKKICGILAEGHMNFSTGKINGIVVGIGINLSTANFPDDIKEKAGSIFSSSAVTATTTAQKNQIFVDREEIIKQIGQECLAIYDSKELSKQAFEEYRQRSMLIGRKVTVHPVINDAQKDFLATVTDISDEAKLIVELPDGTKKSLDSGEVSLIL